jgi:hypothetical protein
MSSAALAATVMAGLLCAPEALADWTAHADFSACPRKHYRDLSRQDPPVATEAECKAQIDRARRGDPAVCIRYSCVEGAGGSGAAPAAPGHELDSTIERAISAGVSGDISAGDAAALVAAGALANAVLAGASPEQQQRRREQAEAARRQAAEQARQQAIAEEQRKDRLLAEMQGVEGSDELQLMTDDGGQQLMAGDTGTGGELALMTDDDDTRGIMGKRKEPQPKRNQPPATRVNPGPYNTPASGPVAREGAGNEHGGGQVPAKDGDPVQLANAGPSDRDSLSKGKEDGGACRQRSAGTHCGALKGEVLSSCQRHYNQGYDDGAAEQERKLKAQGAAAGTRDKNVKPDERRNKALSYSEARGSCGNMFVNSYNQAFAKQ